MKTSSLRVGLARALLLTAVLPFVLLWMVSYSAIYSILSNKIETGLRGTVQRAAKELDRTYENLVSVSHLLSHDQILADELAAFITTQSYAKKREYFDSIDSYLTLVDHANPSAGLRFYTNPVGSQLLFANQKVIVPVAPASWSAVNTNPALTLQAPHATLRVDRAALVVSLFRRVELPEEAGPWNVYVESSPNALTEALPSTSLGMGFWFALVDSRSTLLFSQMPDVFPVGQKLLKVPPSGALVEHGDLLTLSAAGATGWTLVAAVRKSDFNKEIGDWFLLTTLLGVLLLTVAGIVGTSVWRSLYGPIRVLGEEIRRMAAQAPPGVQKTGVVEFDPILSEFHDLNEKVQRLLLEVQQKERVKQRLEVENLLFQINPHFLYNTLNVVQWMAREEGQKPIVQVVSSLIRLLRYNLGKEGTVATLGQEVSALKDYVALLQVRNDHQFRAEFVIDERATDVPLPRFVLQPLVENSLTHGLKDGTGTIEIRARWDPAGFVDLSIRDDGPGLSQDLVEEVAGAGAGFGIGLNYVKKVLEGHYGGACPLSVSSRPGEGTVFSFRIPQRWKEA